MQSDTQRRPAGNAGLPELFRIGARNVGRNRRRSLITGAMIAIAVVGVVFFRGYTLGIRRLMVNAAVKSLTGAFQVQRAGYADSQDLAPLDLTLSEEAGLVEALQKIDGVDGVAPRLVFPGMISNGELSTMVVALAVDPSQTHHVLPMAPGESNGSFCPMLSGTGLDSASDHHILLSSELAAELGTAVGSEVTVVVHTPGGAMESIDLTVRGIFRLDDPLGNKRLSVVPLRSAQKLLHMPGEITAYTVSVHELSNLAATVKATRELLAHRNPPLAVIDWTELAPYYRDVAAMQDGVLGIVTVVVVFIVLAGIMNTMMMSAFERKREIGTLMALGFRRPSIWGLFLIESLWLSAGAGVTGALLGASLVLISAQIGIGFSIPAGGVVMTFPELRAHDVILALCGTMVGSVVAAIIPAIKASRLNPVDALRAD